VLQSGITPLTLLELSHRYAEFSQSTAPAPANGASSATSNDFGDFTTPATSAPSLSAGGDDFGDFGAAPSHADKYASFSSTTATIGGGDVSFSDFTAGGPVTGANGSEGSSAFGDFAVSSNQGSGDKYASFTTAEPAQSMGGPNGSDGLFNEPQSHPPMETSFGDFATGSNPAASASAVDASAFGDFAASTTSADDKYAAFTAPSNVAGGTDLSDSFGDFAKPVADDSADKYVPEPPIDATVLLSL
jgi:hypothetical protein